MSTGILEAYSKMETEIRRILTEARSPLTVDQIWERSQINFSHWGYTLAVERMRKHGALEELDGPVNFLYALPVEKKTFKIQKDII